MGNWADFTLTYTSMCELQADLAEARAKVRDWDRTRQFTNGKEVAKAVAVERQRGENRKRLWHRRRQELFEEAWARRQEKLEADLARVTEERDDYRDSAKKVLAEECPTDEHHCACVPTLRAENAQLRAFAEKIVEETCWGVYSSDLDGGTVQDIALKCGVICEVPGGFDPEQHHDATGACEPGDTFYEFTDALKQEASDE